MKSKREVKFEGDVKLYKCTSCGKFLPYEKYCKNRMGYDGIMAECRECSTKRVTEYRRKNKEKRNAYQREYGRRREMMLTVTGPQPIPEPTYPQPGPQPIPEPHYPQPAVQPKGLSAHQSQSDGVGEPQPAIVSVNFDNREIILTPSINEGKPVITNNIDTTKTYTMSSKGNEISNRLTSFIDKIEKETEELEKEQINYEKEYPNAYQKIMSDEDLSRAFNYKYNEEQKIELLKREQSIIDRKKDTFEYKTDKDKMRAMYDSLLDEQEKKKFDEAINNLGGEWQDKFVHRLGKLPTHQFKNNRKNIYENILELKSGEKKEKDFII